MALVLSLSMDLVKSEKDQHSCFCILPPFSLLLWPYYVAYLQGSTETNFIVCIFAIADPPIPLSPWHVVDVVCNVVFYVSKSQSKGNWSKVAYF